MAAFLKIYQKSFDNRPILTLVCANAALSIVGDAGAQTSQIIMARRHQDSIQMSPPSYDFVRTMRFAIFGGTMGPIIGKWMKFLEHTFPLRPVVGKPSLSAIAKSVASDQFIMAPLGLAVFLGYMGIMEGRTSHEIKQKYTMLYSPALLANWSVWPVIQLVNFRFMPMAYRVPFQSTCGAVWTLYLSLLNSSMNQSMNQGIHTKQAKSVQAALHGGKLVD